jgi:RNA polymerase sigma-70 factor (ECF subfamily)
MDRAEIVDLYEQHSASVYRYCQFRLGSRADAEDATADTFVRLVRGGDGVAPGKRDRWLLKVAKNVCADMLRRSSDERPGRVDPDASTTDRPRVWADPRVRAAVGELTAGQQQIVFLRVLEDLPFAEIGRLCGRSQPAVRMQYHRAVSRLRKRLADLDGPQAEGVSARE